MAFDHKVKFFACTGRLIYKDYSYLLSILNACKNWLVTITYLEVSVCKQKCVISLF